jgi:hypothetical protein
MLEVRFMEKMRVGMLSGVGFIPMLYLLVKHVDILM